MKKLIIYMLGCAICTTSYAKFEVRYYDYVEEEFVVCDVGTFCDKDAQKSYEKLAKQKPNFNKTYVVGYLNNLSSTADPKNYRQYVAVNTKTNNVYPTSFEVYDYSKTPFKDLQVTFDINDNKICVYDTSKKSTIAPYGSDYGMRSPMMEQYPKICQILKKDNKGRLRFVYEKLPI